MKKNILIISVLLLATTIGCKKSLFEENYYNPDKAVVADVPRLYAGLFAHEKVMPRYWNLYTLHVPVYGTYSQTIGYTQSKAVYEQPVNYTGNRWDYFYNHDVSIFREIEKYYNQITDEEQKKGYQLFLETARIFLYDQATQMVDLWGDIPFSSAGNLNLKGELLLPAYDQQEDIYAQALTELKRISDYLAGATPTAFYQNQFQAYDYVNGGDIMKWRKYCNSLMLRLAMRISFVNETRAKEVVSSVLGNPSAYPIINLAEESAVIKANSPESSLLPSDKNEVRNGFGVNPFAPGKMVNDIMVPSSDPRLPVYFTKNAAGNYKGISNTLSEAEVTTGITANEFSRWDSTTFTENYMLPGILIAAAEVQFIKAEAYERWGGGDAKAAYENGIRQSIAFWVNVNHESSYTAGAQEPMPSEAAIKAYLADPQIAYGSSNLAKIATQKWIDFNVVQANQAWAEWRRTKLPVLNFPPSTSVTAPNPPTRFLYPGSERSYNAENYAAVAADDNITTKIFWDVK